MNIIKTHDITLYGGNNTDIILRPLSDDHLPYLYKWCADPEVLYWTEGGTADTNLSYGPETVHQIYGGVSQNALCFLIEVDGVPIGEYWLQRMNLPDVKAMYPEALDVRRIDMCIGEKAYWNCGIGTQFIGMLVDFAFLVSMLIYCIASARTTTSEAGACGEAWLTRYWLSRCPNRRREMAVSLQVDKEGIHQAPPRKGASGTTIFAFPVELQPSQLYISEGKLRLVREWFDPENHGHFDPIPVKRLNDRIVMTDGHTRAVAAHFAGWDAVPVYWDEDELDMRAYAMNVRWCDEEGVHKPINLAKRIVSHKEYEHLWRKRCMEMVLINVSTQFFQYMPHTDEDRCDISSSLPE